LREKTEKRKEKRKKKKKKNGPYTIITVHGKPMAEGDGLSSHAAATY